MFSCSLIDRRGYIQPDTPQPAAPSNGMATYGATQSQSAPSKKALDKVAFLQSKGVVGYNKKKN